MKPYSTEQIQAVIKQTDVVIDSTQRDLLINQCAEHFADYIYAFPGYTYDTLRLSNWSAFSPNNFFKEPTAPEWRVSFDGHINGNTQFEDRYTFRVILENNTCILSTEPDYDFITSSSSDPVIIIRQIKAGQYYDEIKAGLLSNPRIKLFTLSPTIAAQPDLTWRVQDNDILVDAFFDAGTQGLYTTINASTGQISTQPFLKQLAD